MLNAASFLVAVLPPCALPFAAWPQRSMLVRRLGIGADLFDVRGLGGIHHLHDPLPKSAIVGAHGQIQFWILRGERGELALQLAHCARHGAKKYFINNFTIRIGRSEEHTSELQ